VASARDVLYEQLARIGKVVVHPKRIELLELLCQAERSVEAIAVATGLPLTTASTHLQLLRQTRLVETRREGTRVYYRAAGDEVSRFVQALGDLGRDRLVEVQRVLADAGMDGRELEHVTRTELLARVQRGEVVVLDVRPEEEYAAGHVPGARSVPLAQLQARLDELDPATEIVAYCRGPYCLLAPEAVSLLRRGGFRARCLEDGMPEWRHASLPVAVGAET
jgi:rhodanese-related sulfurtransferase/DNA-binding transcriptional ArsR family regulator